MLAWTLLLAAGLAAAAPTPTLLATSALNGFTPYAWYASAGYCEPAATLEWTCGANCEGNPSFVPVAAGGDGSETQYWFVGYDPSLHSVIVSHQGTHPSAIIPLITDATFGLESPDPDLFPGLDPSFEGHSGFLNEQAKTAADVLAAVQKTMTRYGTRTVTTTGHSLGAAIALIDSVYFKLQLPGTTLKTVVYGLPRVVDPAFAAWIDASGIALTHVNNMKDPVPILPGRALGFAHPAGEVHIESVGSWYACPGEDNTSTLCEVGDVPNIFESDESNHDGPYGVVTMGC